MPCLAVPVVLVSGWLLWHDRTGEPLLTTSTPRLELGQVRAGGLAQAEIWLTNPGPTPVTIAAVSSSCPCLHVFPEKSTLAPGEQVRAKVRLDLAHEPDFTGTLHVTVHGTGASGERAFLLVVTTRVSIATEQGAKTSP